MCQIKTFLSFPFMLSYVEQFFYSILYYYIIILLYYNYYIISYYITLLYITYIPTYLHTNIHAYIHTWLVINCRRMGAIGSSPSNGLKPNLLGQKGFNTLCQCVYVYVCIVKPDIQNRHRCSHTSIHKYAYKRIHTHTYIHIYIHTYIHTHTYIHIYIHTHKRILISPESVRHLNMCVLNRNPTYIQYIFKYKIHRNIHTNIHTYIHTYTHTYIHTCIHTYILCSILLFYYVLFYSILFCSALCSFFFFCHDI